MNIIFLHRENCVAKLILPNPVTRIASQFTAHPWSRLSCMFIIIIIIIIITSSDPQSLEKLHDFVCPVTCCNISM
jgi:hypothetical protein